MRPTRMDRARALAMIARTMVGMTLVVVLGHSPMVWGQPDSEPDSEPPLIAAVREYKGTSSELDSIREMLTAGARVDATNSMGTTALHYAAEKGSRRLIQLLIKHGANPNQLDEFGGTPLVGAVNSRRKSAVGYLLEVGAKPNAPAMWQACSVGRRSCIDDFLKAGAKAQWGTISAAAHGSVETLQLLKDAGANFDVADESGELPLHHAIANGRSAAVDWLLDNNVSPHRVDRMGRTALHVAVSWNSTSVDDALKIIERLLAANVSVTAIDHNGHTPLRIAAVQTPWNFASQFYAPLLKAAGGTERQPHQELAPFRWPEKTVTELVQGVFYSADDEIRQRSFRAMIARGPELIPEAERLLDQDDPTSHPLMQLLPWWGSDANPLLPKLMALGERQPRLMGFAVQYMERIQPGTIAGLSPQECQRVSKAIDRYLDEAQWLDGTFSYVDDAVFVVMAGLPHGRAHWVRKQLNSPKQIVRILVVDHLGLFPVETEVLSDVIKVTHSDASHEVRQRAHRTLSYIRGMDKTATAVLRQALLDHADDELVHTAVAVNLARTDPEVIDRIVPFLSPIESDRRRALMDGLTSVHSKAIPKLIQLLTHQDHPVAVSAQLILQRIDNDVTPTLEIAVRDTNDVLVKSAAQILAERRRAPRNETVKLLMNVAEDSRRTADIRQATLGAAVQLDSEMRFHPCVCEVVKVVVAGLRDSPRDQQIEWMTTLGRLGPAAIDAEPVLLELKPPPDLPDEGPLAIVIQETLDSILRMTEDDLSD